VYQWILSYVNLLNVILALMLRMRPLHVVMALSALRSISSAANGCLEVVDIVHSSP
jgi:hypothetical protein